MPCWLLRRSEGEDTAEEQLITSTQFQISGFSSPMARWSSKVAYRVIMIGGLCDRLGVEGADGFQDIRHLFWFETFKLLKS